MKKTDNSVQRPSAAARFLAWPLTFFLALCLALSASGMTALGALTSRDFYSNLGSDSDVADQEMQYIRKRMNTLAEEYGFSPETVQDALTAEEYTELRRKTAFWWKRLIVEGQAEEAPKWSSPNLPAMLEEDPLLQEQYHGEKLWNVTDEITREAENLVNRTLTPVRDRLVLRGTRWVQNRLDYPSLLNAANQLPALGFAVSALLFMLILLLMSRNPGFSLKYLGTALSGAGLNTALIAGLIPASGVLGMLREVSEPLAAQAERIARFMLLRTGGMALAMIAAGGVCLAVYARKVCRPGTEGGVRQ